MRKKRTVLQSDLETGEVLDGVVAYIPRKKQNGFGKGWFAMGQSEALDVLIGFERLEDLKVFCVLLKHLDYENHITAKQTDVAQQLGIQPPNVSRAIKRLLEMGAILKGTKPGYSYQLNPEFGWKGSATNHKQALSDHRKKRMKAANITGVVEGGAAQKKSPRKK
jgi:predicted transcriptional regulator